MSTSMQAVIELINQSVNQTLIDDVMKDIDESLSHRGWVISNIRDKDDPFQAKIEGLKGRRFFAFNTKVRLNDGESVRLVEEYKAASWTDVIVIPLKIHDTEDISTWIFLIFEEGFEPFFAKEVSKI